MFETEGANGFDGGTVLAIALHYKADDLAQFRVSFTTAMRPVTPEGAAEPQPTGELAFLLAREKGQADRQEPGRCAALDSRQ